MEVKERVLLLEDAVGMWVANEAISLCSLALGPLEDGPGFLLDFFLSEQFFALRAGSVDVGAHGGGGQISLNWMISSLISGMIVVSGGPVDEGCFPRGKVLGKAYHTGKIKIYSEMLRQVVLISTLLILRTELSTTI